MLRRIGALIFAAFVLLVSVGIRDERSVGGNDDTDVDQAYEAFDDEPVNVVCVEELRRVCENDLTYYGFRATVEPVWTTADRLAAGGDLGADAWLTFRPFDTVLSGPSSSSSSPATVVARSPLVLTGAKSAIDALDAACPQDATRFACAAKRPTSLVLHDPKSTALGPLSLALLAYESGVLPEAATVADVAVVETLDAVARTSRLSLSPYLDANRLAGETIALTLEANVVDAIEKVGFEETKTYDLVGVRYPLDVRVAEVVLAPVPGYARSADLARLGSSREVSFQFSGKGFETPQRPFFLDYVPVFKDRPTLRTDLSFELQLLKSLRGAG